jgi:DNA-binding CsgD family transcriptional regulator
MGSIDSDGGMYDAGTGRPAILNTLPDQAHSLARDWVGTDLFSSHGRRHDELDRVQLRHELAALEMQWTSLAEAFDRLRDGVIIVDNVFAILFANQSAAELLVEADGMRREGDRLAATAPNVTAALRRLIVGGNGRPAAGGRCVIARGEGRAPLSVTVVPLRGEVSWVASRRFAVVIFISDPDRDLRMRGEALRRRFGLTRAETAFVFEIAKGDGLQAAACRLGVSINTARTHLSHVFSKTGTQRQAELVALATLGPTTLGEDC